MTPEQQNKEWKPVKWVLEPSDPTLAWKKGWNEGGDAAVTAFIQHILESGLFKEKHHFASMSQEIERDTHNEAVKAIKEFITKIK